MTEATPPPQDFEPPLAFLTGGGQMADLIASFDWSRTAVGPIARWPAHMKAATSLMLRCQVGMVMLWRSPGVMIYNDAYSVFAGARHPILLGSDVRLGWPEVADFNDHVMKVGLAGGTLSYQDQELILHRHGRAEQVWMNLDYSPLLDETGTPVGVMAVVVETTAKMQGERRRDALVRLSELLRELGDPAQAGFVAARLLGEALGVSRVGYGTIDAESGALNVERDWCAHGVRSLAGQPMHGFNAFIDSLRRNQLVAVADVRSDERTAAHAPALEAASVSSFVDVPVVEQGRLVALLYVHHAEPRPWSPDDLAFVREVASRTRMAVERVRGEAARRVATQARQDALAAVSALDQRFRALVTASSDVVYRMSPDWAEMYHLDGRDFIASTTRPSDSWVEAYIPPDERARVREAIAKAIRNRGVFELEHQVMTTDGSIGWTFSRAIPVLDARGEIVEWFGAASDVTRRKMVERELQDREERLREADRRKDEFLATLAHELRNPLAPIRNAVHLLEHDAEGEQVGKVREMLGRQVEHMVRLVDDLMEVSRISRGQIELKQEDLPLAQVIDAAIESSRPLIESAGHRLTVLPPGEPLWVRGDPVRLTQVFVNLLNNAARYTDAGGTIEVSSAADGDELVIGVSDNGVGIDAEQLPRLFEMFSQVDRSHSRAQKGLGIGLSLSQRLLQMHGGTLRAESAGLGRGSRFTVRLPRAGASRPVTAPPATEAAPSNLRVLIVDDNRDAADSTGELLALMGAEVRVAYDGSSALDLTRGWKPALALLDIGMPGMDGHELARRLRGAMGRETPYLAALTGWGQDQDRARTRSSGFDHHLVKPVDLTALQRLLASVGDASLTRPS